MTSNSKKADSLELERLTFFNPKKTEKEDHSSASLKKDSFSISMNNCSPDCLPNEECRPDYGDCWPNGPH
jgi:hypothetical protein